MTSVTLPSTSSSIHGVYASVGDETTSSETELEVARPLKRCLATTLADSCKKRRKQSTPVRISAADTEPQPSEGKLLTSSHEPDLQCHVCQLHFNNADQLQKHLAMEHSVSDERREPGEQPSGSQGLNNAERSETPLELTISRSDAKWMNELQNKEWINQSLHSLQFNPSNPMFLSLPQFGQAENMSRQPIRIFNPDAYCDLCNKEFCNKYFLKTHKANKHGIYTDPPASENVTNSVNIPSFASNMKLSTSVPSLDITPVKTESQSSSSIISPFSEMFPNPFPNKMFPKIHKTTMSGLFDNEQSENVPTSNGFSSNSESDRVLQEEPQTETTPSPRNTNTNSNMQTETTSFKTEPDVMLYTSPSKMSPGQRDLDYSTRLRRIGVMNPKAFCEICCKEYCNKYFLRTHKMKRHGIYIPDEKDNKDYKLENTNSVPWQQSTQQTSPLNLIMTEQIDRKTTSPADISCDACGIKFQNSSLAQLHNISVHPKPQPAKKHEPPDSGANNSVPQDDAKRSEHVYPIESKPLNAEAISEDLQKLQTMILQLNELDVNKVPTTCNACNREFENRYFLHAHMMTDHGILLDDVIDMEKSGEADNSSNNNTLCDLCGKDVQNVDEMKKHMMEFHSTHQANIENNRDDCNSFSTPEKGMSKVPSSSGSISERRISMSLTPTSSYCEICNKELCNKYFMKTHMQRMHGIEIENGAQIGGVICDICNKELCSKYFLRVHKHNTHGIVEYGANLLQPSKKTESETTPQIPQEPETALKSSDLADLSHRYFTHFTEVCSLCSRRFRSTKWLKAHLLSDHGPAGAEKWAELEQQLQHTIGQHPKASSQIKTEEISPTLKIPNGGHESNAKQGIQNVLSSLFGVDETNVKSYPCSFCPFTTPLLPLLFVHERSHSLQASDGESSPLKCPVCGQSFLQVELLQHHIFSQHPFLPLPPFFNGTLTTEIQGETSKESSDNAEDEVKTEEGSVSVESSRQAGCKVKKIRAKVKRLDIAAEIGDSLRDVAKKAQLPATYALPQGAAAAAEEEGAASSSAARDAMAGYVMQAFFLEESSQLPERRVVPAVVFLPVLQKQPTPITLTFTLTPA